MIFHQTILMNDTITSHVPAVLINCHGSEKMNEREVGRGITINILALHFIFLNDRLMGM